MPWLDELIAELDEAVDADTPEAITARVKAVLERRLRASALPLDDRFRQPRPDSYARRLLHRDPAGRYTAVVMTWGPGQGTRVHDHGGLWCVEGVVDGQMAVIQYDVEHERDDVYRAVPSGASIRAGVGMAGHLIPPTDYHVLANARDVPSITLHVYGGELGSCRIFEPLGGDRYRQTERTLAYD